MAGELGFEPRQTESESVVLPLHHSPIFSDTYKAFLKFLRRMRLALCKRAPFYSLPAGLGKHAAMLFLSRAAASLRPLRRRLRS